MDWKFNEDKTRIVLGKPPKSRLKVTGTRMGAILGLNPWSTPFKMWCEIVKLHKDPFIENEYTKAGNVIEPIIISWLNKEVFDGSVKDPNQFYGNISAKKLKKFDFYADEKVFGGMWDAKVVDDNGKTYAVIEIKTTSRPQDWVDGVPDEKLLQALLYAHLDGVKRAFVVVAFLEEHDYMNPHLFKPVKDKNIKIMPFDTETTTIMFDGTPCTVAELVSYAQQWWDAYVVTGISPEFTTKDEMILKVLKTAKPNQDEDVDLGSLLKRIDEAEARINLVRKDNKLDDLEKDLKVLKDALKERLTTSLGEEDEKVEVGRWTLSKSERTSVDTDALKKDGLYEHYTKTSVSYTLKSKGE